MIRTYELSHESKTPLYVQLYEAIRADILSGSLPGGEKLPSKRALAEHLSLSKITVETAYAQLLDEGYLTSRERSGYFVAHMPLLAKAPARYEPETAKAPEPEPQQLQSLDTRGRVIYLNTFSKTIAPALRISYMILPQALLARWRSTMGFYSCAVPSFEQLTLTRFLDGGYFERHVSRMKKHYKVQLQGLLELLSQPETARLCTARQAVAGLHFLLEFHTKERGQSLRAALGDAGLSAPLLSEFYLRKSPAEAERCAVVQYSGLTEADFAESLQKLSQRLTPEA